MGLYKTLTRTENENVHQMTSRLTTDLCKYKGWPLRTDDIMNLAAVSTTSTRSIATCTVSAVCPLDGCLAMAQASLSRRSWTPTQTYHSVQRDVVSSASVGRYPAF